MSEFKRSPSKVWWANESIEWREASASPGSQDSGFSDSESSPPMQILLNQTTKETPKTSTTAQRVPKDIFKQLSSGEKSQNLSVNYVEKITPKKLITSELKNRLVKSDSKVYDCNRNEIVLTNTDPVRKSKFIKHSPKVSRNLFINAKQKESRDVIDAHQYAEDVIQEATQSSVNSEETLDDSHSWQPEDSFEVLTTRTLPPGNNCYRVAEVNKSAPAEVDILSDNEGVTSFNNSLSSDCESELECLFNGNLDSPKHTSTPKARCLPKMRQKASKIPLNLYLQYQQERVPPIVVNEVTDNRAVRHWLEEARGSYEQECMTTLQCKSIAGELSQKVSQKAAMCTAAIREILTHSRCIEIEYQNLNSEKQHIQPLIQSLVGNIMDFLRTYKKEINGKILKLHDNAIKANCDDALKFVSKLFSSWESYRHDILTKEVKKLIDNLEDPRSELDLRGTVTGITSVTLRNEELIELFAKADIIPILLILCEKCEGSSIRSLILRALSTVCVNTFAVRQFEKFSGVQLIADILEEDARPEPERSEAVALLAQVTAPWIEDNHCVKGLQEYSRSLVKSLTKFASSTKCCQNLLLCSAALANLSTMDAKSIKYMVHINTVRIILEAVKSRGPRASVYLLEQVSTLVANMSAIESARKHLTEIDAPMAMLCFLKACHQGEDVEKRLQQKSIIALSRLCGDQDAATQIVELGGIEKLVKMCREKSERYDNDAVLVATLATLRKIADTCGNDVLSTQDAQELVEPKLLDSFLAYSTQNESYV